MHNFLALRGLMKGRFVIRIFRSDIAFQCGDKRSRREIGFFSSSDRNGNGDAWQKAVSNAEKLVGFPTSFLSLRALLSDEFGGLAIHLRKLISTKHPLVNTARGIVFDSKNYMQTRGLIVLLASKICSGDPTDINFASTELYEKQRSLAETTELIHIAFLVHRGIVDADDLHNHISKSDIDFGNKLAVLGGDFMLANACAGLAKLNNTEVVDLIATSIGDMSAALLTLPDSTLLYNTNTFENFPVNRDQWVDAIRLANGSLLTNACRSALLLASSDQKYVNSIGEFAHYLVLAQQAKHDISRFASMEIFEQKPNFCSLCSLPVVLLTEENGGIKWMEKFISKSNSEHFSVNSSELYRTVLNDKFALSSAQEQCHMHIDNALNCLNVLPESEAKSALGDIVRSVALNLH